MVGGRFQRKDRDTRGGIGKVLDWQEKEEEGKISKEDG